MVSPVLSSSLSVDPFSLAMPPQAVVSPPPENPLGLTFADVFADSSQSTSTDESADGQAPEYNGLDYSNTYSLSRNGFQFSAESGGYESYFGPYTASPESILPHNLPASAQFSFTGDDASSSATLDQSVTTSADNGTDDDLYRWLSDVHQGNDAGYHELLGSSSSTSTSTQLSGDDPRSCFTEEVAREAGRALGPVCVGPSTNDAVAYYPQPEVPVVEDEAVSLSQNYASGSLLFSGDWDNFSTESNAAPSLAGLDEGAAVGEDVLHHPSSISGNDDTLIYSGPLTYEDDSIFSQLPFYGVSDGSFDWTSCSGSSASTSSAGRSYSSGSWDTQNDSGFTNASLSLAPVSYASSEQYGQSQQTSSSSSLGHSIPVPYPPVATSSGSASITSNTTHFDWYSYYRDQRLSQASELSSVSSAAPQQDNGPSSVEFVFENGSDDKRARTPCISKTKVKPAKTKKTQSTEAVNLKRMREADENVASHADSGASAGPSQSEPKRWKSSNAGDSSTYGVYCPHPAKGDRLKRCDKWLPGGPKTLRHHIKKAHGLPPLVDVKGELKLLCPLFKAKDSLAICGKAMVIGSLTRHVQSDRHELETRRLGQDYETSGQRMTFPKIVECKYCKLQIAGGRGDALNRHMDSCKKKSPN